MKKLSKGKKSGLFSVIALIAIIVGALSIYLSAYYRADMEDILNFEAYAEAEYYLDEDGYTVFPAEDATAGFIFYPGGKVEANAYLPLMAALSERGITSVLVKMPFNLAVFDINAADGIRERMPEITDWYIGGHSLGGSMAASYLETHTDGFSGLVLLGAYSTADLSGTSLRAICLHGSEDLVMNREKHDECLVNLPARYIEQEIGGGCHAYFGMYGEQKGDGIATITSTEQITLTADIVSIFIKKGN